MKEIHRASLALIVSDYGQEEAIRHVEVVVVLRLARDQDICPSSARLGPKEGPSATTDGDTLDQSVKNSRM